MNTGSSFEYPRGAGLIAASVRTTVKARARLAALLIVIVGAVAMQGCATLPPRGVDKTPSTAIAASVSDELGRIAAQNVPAGAESGFRPLPQSNYSMDARLSLARHAQKSLDLQYYLLQNDVTGHKLLRAVRDAALRGVRVRILVDDLYTADSDRMLVELAAYPNLEIRLFNPFPAGRAFAATRWTLALSDFARVNHRMHNKMFIADGVFAVAGGRNIADEYFFSNREGNFVDFDLLVTGAAVTQMAAIFDNYWNNQHVYPLAALETSDEEPAALRQEFEALSADAESAYPRLDGAATDILGYSPLSHDLDAGSLRLMYGHVDVFADDPEKVTGKAESGNDTTTVTYHVLRAMAGAQSELTIGSPYFIPGPLGMARMEANRERGVHVVVMTNSLASSDEPFASAAFARYRVAMLKMGIELYEIDPEKLKRDPLIGAALRASIGRSHSKLVVIDRHLTFVGSMNMDLRSSRLNTELGLLVDSPDLANAILALAQRMRSSGSFQLKLTGSDGAIQWWTRENGVDKVYDSEPDVDLATQLKILLLFPFVSESLL